MTRSLRKTITMSEEVLTQVVHLQADMIRKDQKNHSFSSVIEILLLKGLNPIHSFEFSKSKGKKISVD